MALILFFHQTPMEIFLILFCSCKLNQHFWFCLQLIWKSCCNTSANSGHSKEASLPWFIISVSSFFLFVTWDFINRTRQSFFTCPYLQLRLSINNFIDYACPLFPSPLLNFNFWLSQDLFNEFIPVLSGKTCPALYFLCPTHCDSLTK